MDDSFFITNAATGSTLIQIFSANGSRLPVKNLQSTIALFATISYSYMAIAQAFRGVVSDTGRNLSFTL